MAIQSRNTLKGWFVTLAKPVQSQFWDWIDSFRHKSEKIASADLDQELLDIINSFPPAETLQLILDGLQNKADLNEEGTLIESQWPTILVPDQIVFSDNGQYIIPDGRLLDMIVIIPTVDITISIGTFENGNNIMPELLLSGGTAEVLTINQYANGAPLTIYFSGINADTTIKFYKK